MITRIGVICQDQISVGFLYGLRDRLKCNATFIPGPIALGRSRNLTRKQAKLAWEHFKKESVDLVVRFTDADRDRWQDVQRTEKAVFPEEAKAIFVCGVAVNNPEEWLCLDVEYMSSLLGFSPNELRDSTHRTDRIKHALGRRTGCANTKSDTVAKIVREAPPNVFNRWLKDDSLRAFYTECRAAASTADCETPNELKAPA